MTPATTDFENAIERATREIHYVICWKPWMEYTVPSASDANVEYTVTTERIVDEYGIGWLVLHCTCLAGQNGVECKHIGAVWIVWDMDRKTFGHNRHFPHPDREIPSEYLDYEHTYIIPGSYRWWG